MKPHSTAPAKLGDEKPMANDPPTAEERFMSAGQAISELTARVDAAAAQVFGPNAHAVVVAAHRSAAVRAAEVTTGIISARFVCELATAVELADALEALKSTWHVELAAALGSAAQSSAEASGQWLS